MKKLLTLCLLLTIAFTSQAQEIKKYYIIFYTQDYAAKHYVNSVQEWKPEVPYKKYVRFITTPFDAPENMANGAAISNQLAEFVFKNYLPLFEKLKFQNTSLTIVSPNIMNEVMHLTQKIVKTVIINTKRQL